MLRTDRSRADSGHVRDRATRVTAELADPEWLQRRHLDEHRPAGQIAAEIGVTPNAVRKALQRHNIDYITEPVRPAELDSAEWLRSHHHHEGKSITDIAGALGVANSTVRAALHRHGLAVRRPDPHPKFAELADPGWLQREYIERRRSIRNIAADVGASRETVRLALKSAGITPRGRGHHG